MRGIKVAYCGYVRKDGSINQLTFYPEEKTFTNKDVSSNFTFVEARISADVDALRDTLKENGYKEV